MKMMHHSLPSHRSTNKKKKYKIFVDGSHGTTGLEINQRLKKIKNITLIEISYDLRKNLSVKKSFYKEADLVVLCLSDKESTRSYRIINEIWKKNGKPLPKILDTSTSFRTHSDWVYGHPQLFPDTIRNAYRVANPGCYAIGFVSLIYPLVKLKLIPTSETLNVFGVSGYSGGGRKMVSNYESTTSHKKNIPPVLPYGLDLEHKHIPEMKKVCGLKNSPIFIPIVGSFYRGMLIFVPLPFSRWSKIVKKLKEKVSLSSPAEVGKTLKNSYQNFYSKGKPIKVKLLSQEKLYEKKFLSPLVEHDLIEIIITTRKNGDATLIARLNNLGKGASGNAIENIRLMLGI